MPFLNALSVCKHMPFLQHAFQLEAGLTAVKAANAKLEAALALRVGEISDLNEELATCDGLGGCGRVAGRYKRKKQEEKRKKFQS